MSAPDLSPDEAALIDLFELSDDGPYDPCPDCGGDPADSSLHVEGCRRINTVLQWGPPWETFLSAPSALDRLRAAFADGTTTTSELQPLIDALTAEQVVMAWDGDLLTLDQAVTAFARRTESFPCPEDEHVDVDSDGFCRGCGETVEVAP